VVNKGSFLIDTRVGPELMPVSKESPCYNINSAVPVVILFTRYVLIFPVAAELHRSFSSSKSYCLVMKAHARKQARQSIEGEVPRTHDSAIIWVEDPTCNL